MVAHDQNTDWMPALAVQTRAQTKQPEQIKTLLKTPNIIDMDISNPKEESGVNGNAKFFCFFFFFFFVFYFFFCFFFSVIMTCYIDSTVPLTWNLVIYLYSL